MSQAIRVRWLLMAALAVVVGAAGLMGAGSAKAQDNGALMKAIPPATEVKKGQDRIPIDITIENAKNMASFQFILQFNADILEAASTDGGPVVQKGDFLGSTGREVVCSDATTEPGAVRFQCVTLRPTPNGPDGAGKLATVYLKAIGSGETTLTLDRVKGNLVDADSTEFPIAVQNAPLKVTGDSGGIALWMWALIVAGGLVVGLAAVGGTLMLRSRSGGGTAATSAP